MKKFWDKLKRPVPRCTGLNLPEYYKRALFMNEGLLMGYFILMAALNFVKLHTFYIAPLIMAAALLAKHYFLMLKNMRINLACHAAISMIWCGLFIRTLGWGNGGQHLLLPVLVLVFFSVFLPSVSKILYFIVMVMYRMVLFAFSLMHDPLLVTSMHMSIFYQTVNSFLLFFMLAANCVTSRRANGSCSFTTSSFAKKRIQTH